MVMVQPSTEDRVEAMRSGHERVVGLTLEEDEERLMRIAIRESAAESRRGKSRKKKELSSCHVMSVACSLGEQHLVG